MASESPASICYHLNEIPACEHGILNYHSPLTAALLREVQRVSHAQGPSPVPLCRIIRQQGSGPALRTPLSPTGMSF